MSPGSTPAPSAGPPADSWLTRAPSLNDLFSGDRIHAEQQHDGDQHVHDRASRDHQEAARKAFLSVRAGFVAWLDLVHTVHADDPDEGPQRHRERTPYSVSPRRKLQSLGPKNKKNCVTFMPVHRAVR